MAWDGVVGGGDAARIRIVAGVADDDEQYIAAVRRLQNGGMAVRPYDAFRGATTWTSHSACKAKERARQKGLERDKHRYDRPAAKSAS